MWKRNDAPIQNTPTPAPQPQPAPGSNVQPSTPIAAVPPPVIEKPRPAPVSSSVTIGASVVIKGEVSAKEDLTISGRIEGKVEVREHVVRIAPGAQVNAEILGRTVLVEGRVTGNITASERIELLENGAVEGDISAPKVAMADGAEFRGKIEMGRKADAVRKSA